MEAKSIPLSVYEVRCAGAIVGYLTINDNSEWGEMARKHFESFVGLIDLIPINKNCLIRFVNDNIKGEQTNENM